VWSWPWRSTWNIAAQAIASQTLLDKTKHVGATHFRVHKALQRGVWIFTVHKIRDERNPANTLTKPRGIQRLLDLLLRLRQRLGKSASESSGGLHKEGHALEPWIVPRPPASCILELSVPRPKSGFQSVLGLVSDLSRNIWCPCKPPLAMGELGKKRAHTSVFGPLRPCIGGVYVQGATNSKQDVKCPTTWTSYARR
jgi:hypothetical protein